jgi:hypothetical protein
MDAARLSGIAVAALASAWVAANLNASALMRIA